MTSHLTAVGTFNGTHQTATSGLATDHDSIDADLLDLDGDIVTAVTTINTNTDTRAGEIKTLIGIPGLDVSNKTLEGDHADLDDDLLDHDTDIKTVIGDPGLDGSNETLEGDHADLDADLIKHDIDLKALADNFIEMKRVHLQVIDLGRGDDDDDGKNARRFLLLTT